MKAKIIGGAPAPPFSLVCYAYATHWGKHGQIIVVPFST